MDLRNAPAHTIRDAIRDGSIEARAVVESVLDAIARDESDLHCYLHLAGRDRLLEEADRVDEARRRGDPLPLLAGIPCALKDNIVVKGMPATCGSKMLERFHPPYTATAARRLLDAGALITGKTNMDEFAMGSSTENSAFGATRNPWGRDRVPGGSSGGSAAAVAAGEALFALGSDTGGSIRQPAAFCGVAGLKPTYGAVSRRGLVAFASSFDQIGPIGRSVRDVAMVFDAIAGVDPRDSTSATREGGGTEETLDAGVAGLRVGVAEEFFREGLDAEVARAVRRGIEALRVAGAAVVDISLSSSRFAIPAYYIAADAEASANLARFDGVRYGLRRGASGSLGGMYRATRNDGFGAEVKRRILIGTFALSSGYREAWYERAMKVRSLVAADYAAAFEICDIIAGPATPTTAFRLGEKQNDPLAMYLSDVYTISANLAGLPALVVPCGSDRSGLPVAIQLTGRAFDEATLLGAGAAVERAGLFSGGPRADGGEHHG